MVKKNKKALHKFSSFQSAVSLNLDKDNAQAKAFYYHEKVKEYLRKDEKALTDNIIKYCFAKIEKLKNDIIVNQKYDYIKFFMKFALIDINEIDKEKIVLQVL
ncbi:hypothetical protein RhiirA4_452586 [Rhizophagus irregularis]|uniref:Uncharacterized protein n=1 Tax=Rhizophagus irregularis TaxID=588596 RepID=A0A2I1FYF9_9GLOM|nr:hypothetical protein RhiirA4_452586 [Rhizophagus irregularis]